MVISSQHDWFTEHRGWEDFFSAGLGVLIVLSPALAMTEENIAITINAGLIGVIITAVGLLEVMALQRWEEIIELIAGAWMVVAPFVLQYGDALRVAHIVLGGLVAALAIFELWQDRNRRLKA